MLSSSSAAAAPSSSSSSQKHSNFARLCWLLIDTGTQVLREVFDNIHKPTSLHAVLHSTSVHNALNQLKSRRILNTQQWSKLYPIRSTSVSSASFDVTLLFALLRNICNLTPPPTGWDKPPAASDLSKEADLARIKWYRNEVYAHRTETAVSDADFEILWTDISDVLIRLGGQDYKTSIQRLKVEPMDSDDEKYFIKMLEEGKQLGDELPQKMDEVLKEAEGSEKISQAATSASASRDTVQAHSLDDVHKMTSNPRGLFIIISMEKFTNLVERKGSERDANNLKELFKDFGFKTKILRDMGKQDLLSYLKTEAKNPELENHDCFGLCIMSHGQDDHFYASDGETIKLTEIRDMFKNSKCEGLKGKPKLFFIEASRGRLIDHGVRIRSDYIPHRRPPGQQETISSVQEHYNEGTIPEDADILMAYACMEGHQNFRNIQRGSFFIQSLVEVFREHYREEDLMSMLTKVNQKVSELGTDRAKQMPKPETTLRKKVYFS